MNILLINHYAGSESLGMEFRPWYLAKEWIKLGHKVTILSASYSHLRTFQPEIHSIYEKKVLDHVNFLFLKTPKYKGNGFKRVLNIFMFVYRLKKFGNKIYNEFKPDIVIASSTYPFDIYPAHQIAKKSKAKLVFEVHDLWPLSPMELGGYSKYHPFIMMIQNAENYAYKNADHVVSLLPNTKLHMMNHGLLSKKFNYIPNGIDISAWEIEENIPFEHDKLLSKLKKDKKIIVGYVGTHGLANALNTFIASAKGILNQNIVYVLVGNGNEKEKLIKSADELELNNVYFLPPVQKKVIPSLLSKFDILYIGWSKNKLYRFGISPNKLFDYMMAGKPIIHSVYASNDPVKESNCGISVDPENPRAIAQAIDELTSLGEEEKINMGINAKKYVIDNHNYMILAEEFINIFK
jgi:glycosyltransferase involved in cell wall biosynthesis